MVVAVLGLLGTGGGAIAGVLITQHRSDQREKVTWHREREREHEHWAREDAARTFELRRTAYIELFEAVREQRVYLHASYATIFSESANKTHSLPHFAAEGMTAMQKVRIYGSSAVVAVADETDELLRQTMRAFADGSVTVRHLQVLKADREREREQERWSVNESGSTSDGLVRMRSDLRAASRELCVNAGRNLTPWRRHGVSFQAASTLCRVLRGRGLSVLSC
jgi:hypothetical protein